MSTFFDQSTAGYFFTGISQKLFVSKLFVYTFDIVRHVSPLCVGRTLIVRVSSERQCVCVCVWSTRKTKTKQRVVYNRADTMSLWRLATVVPTTPFRFDCRRPFVIRQLFDGDRHRERVSLIDRTEWLPEIYNPSAPERFIMEKLRCERKSLFALNPKTIATRRFESWTRFSLWRRYTNIWLISMPSSGERRIRKGRAIAEKRGLKAGKNLTACAKTY